MKNNDLSDHPGIGSGPADVYAPFLFSKKPGIHHRLLKFMNPYSAEKRKSPRWKKSTGYSTAKMKADARYLEKIGFHRTFHVSL